MLRVIQPFYYFTFLISLLATTHCAAQLELSNNIELGYPFVINENNSKYLYGQITAGLRLGISYKPENTQFFPTLHYAFGRTRLPLKQFGKNVAALDINYQNLMLNGNYVINFENYNQVYIYGGIGFVVLKDKGLRVSGNDAQVIKVNIDSVSEISPLSPAINLGVEYVVGQTSKKPLYVSFGVNVQYWYFLPGRNNYYLSVTDGTGNYKAPTGLTGNAIAPFFYMSLHYLVDQRIIFWRKKDSRYL